MQLPIIIHTISKELRAKEARAIVVGGSVRDHFLSIPIKDFDIEVYGLESLDELETVLREYGSVNQVGRSFGIVKFVYEGEEYDFSFPRTETKSGEGHRGFDVVCDGAMDYTQAARRRDFTINAMGYDIEAGEFLDPFGGMEDIGSRTLRHIDDDTFIEDPLRVYRAVQFCARFGFTLADETADLCRDMTEQGMLEELPRERIYTEWLKILLKSPRPSIGFELMRSLGILRYFPELAAIIDVPQSIKWHPEGDVWIHTMMCLDAMAAMRSDDERNDLICLLAVLCHDLGKATTTTIDEGGAIRAIGHEYAGEEPTRTLLARLTNEHDLVEAIIPLVKYHLAPSQYYKGRSRNSAILRLAAKVDITTLVRVARADFLGRTTEESLRGIYDAGDWLLAKAADLKVSDKPLDPLVMGRDLIALGLQPSPQFKEILNELYELQMDEKIATREEGLEYVRGRYL